MKPIFKTITSCFHSLHRAAISFTLPSRGAAHLGFHPMPFPAGNDMRQSQPHPRAMDRLLRRHGWLVVLAAAFFAGGCSPREAAMEAPRRAVKLQTIAGADRILTRSFAGVVQACNRSSLSFQVAGRIEQLPVEIGDTVQKGQVLAELDPAPFELRARQAEADAQAARAQLAEREKRFASEQRLLPKGATTQTEYDQAEAALATAKSQLEIAESAMRLARRDLSHARLTAPISGRIARRHLQNYSQAAPGICLLELDGEGDFEVATAIPEGFAAHTGDKVGVVLKSNGTAAVEGTITQIGSRSDIGNSMPVLVRLAQSPHGLRTGTAAEVRFKDSNQAGNLFIPIGGVIPGPSANTGFVFVFDPQKGTMQKRPVQLGTPQGDSFPVLSGLAPGEMAAAAGVAFLTDGQPVRAWNGPEAPATAPAPSRLDPQTAGTK